MKSKNMIIAFVLSAFIAAPIMMSADCGTKTKAECAKESSKEEESDEKSEKDAGCAKEEDSDEESEQNSSHLIL